MRTIPCSPAVSACVSGSMIACVVGTAAAGPSYTIDFESGAHTGASRISVGGFEGLGSGDQVLSGSMLHVNSRTPASVLVEGFESPATVELSFALAVIDSWDGEAPDRNYAPDFIGVRVNGEEVFLESFTNFEDGEHGNIWGASANLEERVAYGKLFGNGGWRDSVYDITVSGIEHDGGVLDVEFFATGEGFQGGNDESFGVDSLSVTAIPAPGAFATGLVVGWLGMRRRRAATLSS